MNATTPGPRPRRYASVTTSPPPAPAPRPAAPPTSSAPVSLAPRSLAPRRERVSVSLKEGSAAPSCLIVDVAAMVTSSLDRHFSRRARYLALPHRGTPSTRAHEAAHLVHR